MSGAEKHPESNNGKPKQTLMENLAGATDVMLGREKGLDRIDQSPDGFWWSFSGIALAGLVDASGLTIIHSIRANVVEPAAYSKPAFVVLSLMVALLAYGASMLALYLLCRLPEQQSRFASALIVHNWAAPVISVGFLPLLWMASFFRDGQEISVNETLPVLLMITSFAVLVMVGQRLIRISLNLSLGQALSFLATTGLVSIFITQGFNGLLGL